MLGLGRDIITTPYSEVTQDNVVEIIQAAMPIFQQNAADCDFLMKYDAGVQPLKRENEKKFMPWIDCQAVDNVAHEISDFWVGYLFGSPITIKQRGDSEKSEEKANGVKDLNSQYYITGSASKQQKMADRIVKCGHCYTLDEVNADYEVGESVFTRDILDPRSAFVVYSSYYSDKRPILGVTFSRDSIGTMIITAYSKTQRFDITAVKLVEGKRAKAEKYDEWKHGYNWNHLDRSGEANPMNRVPIVEWFCNYDRTGFFENQINALDNINLLVSDISNGFEQNVQAIWWSNNVEFETEIIKDDEGNDVEIVKKPKNGDWVQTNSPKDGGAPSIEPLVIDYHLEDMQKSYTEQRQLALQKAHVPNRNDTSGGSSGVAMDSASGWADAEAIASTRREVLCGCFMDELKVILSIIKKVLPSDNDMTKLFAADLEPYIQKPKNTDINSKVNGISTLIKHGFALEDALSAIPLFADTTQVIARSGEGVKAYQRANVFSEGTDETANSERMMPDMSDQVERSRILQNG